MWDVSTPTMTGPSLHPREDGEKIDEMLAQEGPYTFDVPIFGKTYPLNLTLSSAPQIGGDLINIYFDGLFNLAENATDEHNFPKEVNTEWPTRFEHSHSE